MIRRQRTIQGITLLALDALAIVAAFLLAYWLRFGLQIVAVKDLPGMVPGIELYRPVLWCALVIVPLVLASMGLYRVRRTNARGEAYIAVAGGISLGIIAVAGLVSLLYRPETLRALVSGENVVTIAVPPFSVSRYFLLFFYVNTLLAVVGARVALQAFYDHLRRTGRNLKRVLIAGTGPLARVVIDKMRLHEEFGFRIVGMLARPADGDEAEPYRGVPIVGQLADALDVVRGQQIDQLYLALPLSAHEEILDLLRAVSHEIVDVKVVPDLLQYIALRAGVEDLDGVPIVNLSRVPLDGFSAVLKRGFDLIVAAACLVLFAPLFPIVALAVKLTSEGPIFYRQLRMGLDGRPFELMKFRSMVVDAESTTGPVWADEEDSRCTPVGALLRKLSLDELPQFWNILRGDMSLVGPRPERPYFVDEFRHRIPHYMLRHRVRAGLTGWAQVHGWRGNTSLEKRIEYDLYYIENWSLALDFKILWMTVSNGMVHEHAY